MGIEARFIKALEAEVINQAKTSLRGARDDDKAFGYGISIGIDRGLNLAIDVIRKIVANDNKLEEEDDDN